MNRDSTERTPQQVAEDCIRHVVSTRQSRLVLSQLGLEELPPSIGRCTQLQSIHLEGNQLSTLPDSLGQCARLERLYLQNNRLTVLPESIGKCAQLAWLQLSGNRLIALPESIGQCRQLRRLYLSGNHLTALPECIGQCTWLEELSLSGNSLTTLPESIGQCANLKQLSVSNTLLVALPQSIGECTELRGISLENSKLRALPNSIGQCVRLEWLHLSGNQLAALPETIGQCKRLERIELDGNQLTELPESIGLCAQLESLYLEGNRLGSLPASMQELTKLAKLFLHGNNALDLPLELLGPRYRDVGECPPADPQAILAYYFQRYVAARPLNELKLLLVGRGGTGKTSIVQRLCKNQFDPHQLETKGITIEPWQLGCGSDDVRVHLWDFAGQVITHAAHQFFLTQRSLYVLVLTGREDVEASDAEYWLRLINAFGTDRETGEQSPVIIALNKWKAHPYTLDRHALKEKYPFVVKFVETDCEPNPNGFGIDTLRKLIVQTIADMKSVHIQFPGAWWKIKERLAVMRTELKQEYLKYADYQILCSKLGETDEGNQKNLAIVLHALGVALNYADDPRLKDATILDPHWVTNGIYSVLRDAVRDDGSGEVSLEDVARVLPNEKPDMRRYLVELMRRFDLAFPIGKDDGEDTDRWLVPQRLPDVQPALGDEWRGRDCTRLRYRYSALPEGLLPRFITRTYPLSEETRIRWVNGVVLASDGARALVKADPAERLVTVTVHSDSENRDARRLVGLIRTELKRIHDDINRLDPAEEIELEEKPGVFVPLRTLEIDERKGMPSFAPTAEGTIQVHTTAELNRVSAPAARDPNQWKAKLFISHSSKDAKQHDQLKVRLTPMQSEGLVETWSDRCLLASQPWDKVIRDELRAADVIVFLVSAEFLASDYIRDVELDLAIKRHAAGEAEVVPIILAPCDWERSPLKRFQALPIGGKPIRKFGLHAEAWHQVAEGLRAVLERLRDQHKNQPFQDTFAASVFRNAIRGMPGH